jgi:hypothetical protein
VYEILLLHDGLRKSGQNEIYLKQDKSRREKKRRGGKERRLNRRGEKRRREGKEEETVGNTAIIKGVNMIENYSPNGCDNLQESTATFMKS